MASVENERRTRTVEDVREKLQQAKLEEHELQSTSYSLGLSPELYGKEVRLLELDAETLRYIEEGKTLVIRGEKDDSAVLCTEDATYDIKEAEISNTMLLTPDHVLPADEKEASEEEQPRQLKEATVCGLFSHYLELRPGLPHTHKLRQVLSQSEFCGEVMECDSVRKYTLKDLLSVVQASERELILALYEMKACCIEGYWRLLGFDYHFRVASHILNLVEENSWPIDAVPREVVMDTLKVLEPIEVLQHMLGWYLEDPVSDGDDEQLCALKEDEVCRLLGEALLRAAGRFNLKEFLKSWQQSVPEGMKTSLEQLEGLALVDSQAKPPVIWWFAHYELAEDPGERMEALFHAKDRWTLSEITPYLEKLTVGKQNVATILTKYTRASMHDGIKYYTAKYKR